MTPEETETECNLLKDTIAYLEASRNLRAAAAEMDFAGADLAKISATSFKAMQYNESGLSGLKLVKYLDKAIAVLKDHLMNARFSPGDVS